MNGVTAMDENGDEIKSPIKRLGSTRKLLVFNNIRLQLNEQLRCLDVRMESQVSLIQELQDFFRRRGEVELDYSKSLDKLAKSLQLRHKEQKQKREQWPVFSSYACWQQLINQTKSLSKDHAALSEIYSTLLVARLQTVIEDVQRIYRRCREIGYETHEEILRVLQELHTTMKTYQSYQNECKAAETKLRTAENQRTKLQQTIPKEKLERSKKYRLIEKEVLKRKNKYTDARLKALKAKNEYQLCLEASNTTIHKYFVEDLSDLIDCMDLGFHSVVSRALLMHVTADQGRCRAFLSNADNLSHTVHSMDSRADKQKFLEQHHGAFMIPKRLEFQGQQGEEIEPELQKALHNEMEARLQHLEQRVNNLRMESEEIWKTLETAEINLLDILNTKDYDCSGYFNDATSAAHTGKPENLTIKLRSDKQEIEEFYISKIREYILGTSRIARLDSKAEYLRNTLAKDSALHTSTLIKSNVPKRKRIGRMNMSGQPKLFGGSLEEYLEVTGDELPLIMRSCIRVINLYGLHHQGIFRVSGSQVEISNFRESFERGEDPLADTTDASDINSVAGVLKLYLRELREPLFPIIYFDHFVTLTQLDSKHEMVIGIRKFLQSLPRPVIIVIRYLFAFLNHLSEYSDENMMDAYNLAICFGPTLMPAPEDKDQVQFQNQVNELIKNMIVFCNELFSKDIGGTLYEKYISQEPFIDIDVGDSPTDQVTEDPDSEVYPSEDESDTLEATAQFEFNARSNRELSLRKGDLVILRKQVSNDWWQGTVNGKDGLVPDKYISLKIKDEDREKSNEHMKSSSSEESVRKRRPSGNINVGSQLSVSTQSSQYTLNNDAGGVGVGGGGGSGSSAGGGSVHATTANDTQLTTSSISRSISIPQQQQHQQQQHSQQTMQHPQQQLPPPSSTHNHQVQHQQSQQQTSSPLPIMTATMPSNAAITINNNNNNSNINTNTNIIGNNYQESDFHYDSVENVRNKYNYHDEPHSFENSMDFLEDINHFQFENKKPSEPIYAEPTKTHAAVLTSSGSVLNNKEFMTESDDTSEVILRNPVKGSDDKDVDELGFKVADDSRSRHSDTECLRDNVMRRDGSLSDDGDSTDGKPTRKYHSKSLSLSGSGFGSSNLFHQNRELWEKRAELSSQQSLTTPRILSRNRIAPDLVMDLPFPIDQENAIRASNDSLENDLDEAMTSAERFAAQNQSTLKKNERFSSEPIYDNKKEKPKVENKTQEMIKEVVDKTVISTTTAPLEMEKSKTKILEEVLHIKEEEDIIPTKDMHKSPIPTRNTQKYVTQFADLHLTGGCLSQSEAAHTTPVSTVTQQQQGQQTVVAPQLSSFKPQVKVKPQILKKPLVLPPTTPEMVRRNQD